MRFRDIGQIWELATQLILYATPIIYPVGFLPEWARTIAFLNPFVQILQDVRAIVLYQDIEPNLITAADVFDSVRRTPDTDRDHARSCSRSASGSSGRQAPWFAERV